MAKPRAIVPSSSVNCCPHETRAERAPRDSMSSRNSHFRNSESKTYLTFYVKIESGAARHRIPLPCLAAIPRVNASCLCNRLVPKVTSVLPRGSWLSPQLGCLRCDQKVFQHTPLFLAGRCPLNGIFVADRRLFKVKCSCKHNARPPRQPPGRPTPRFPPSNPRYRRWGRPARGGAGRLLFRRTSTSVRPHLVALLSLK